MMKANYKKLIVFNDKLYQWKLNINQKLKLEALLHFTIINAIFMEG